MRKRCFTLGRKFSTSTSARSTRRSNTECPSSVARSTIIERLLRCRFAPSEPPDANEIAPLGGHTCTTSAPKSASWRTHVGPALATARSTTRTPESGPSSTRLPRGERGDPCDHHDEAEHHVGDRAPDRRLREHPL